MAELNQDEQTYLRRLRESVEQVARIQDRAERLEKMSELGSAELLEKGLTEIRQNLLNHLIYVAAKPQGIGDGLLDEDLLDLLRQNDDVLAIKPHLSALSEAVSYKK